MTAIELIPSFEVIRDFAASITIVRTVGSLASSVGKIVTRSDEYADRIARSLALQRPDKSDLDAALNLLGLTGSRVTIFATPGHFLYGQATHPADREAALYLSGTLGFSRSVRRGGNVVDNHIIPDFRGTQIIFGGANSQPWIRTIFEFEFAYKGRGHRKHQNPDYLVRRSDALIPLPYGPTTNAADPAVPLTRMRAALGGKLGDPRPAWSFVGADPAIGRPLFKNGYRILDWLHLTRIRNFLSPEWGKPGDEGSIVYASGASGVGTRAVRLLFQPGVAQQLCDLLVDESEFQILLPVEVGYSKSGMFPVRIDVLQAVVFPLTDLDLNLYEKARARIGKRVTQVISRATR